MGTERSHAFTFSSPIAAASQTYGMSACLSATSVIYAFAAALLLVGIRVYLRRADNVRIEAAAAPDPDAMEFMDAFLAEYREAMAKLADR